MSPSISIVIPAYNEEANIHEAVKESLEVLESLTEHFEVLVMDDASSDRTGEILDEWARKQPGKVRAFHHSVNQGTNLSLIELFGEAHSELIFFLPADRQIRADSLPAYLSAVQGGADVVLGWRRRRADPPHRLFFNWLYRTFLKWVAGISFRDAAASDLYKKEVLSRIRMESRGRFLQAEIAVKAARLGYRVEEIEVAHHPRTGGKQTGIKPKTLWLSLTDLWRVGPSIRRLDAARRI